MVVVSTIWYDFRHTIYGAPRKKTGPIMTQVDIYWIVVRGYDDSDTPQVEDDKFYVNDPYWQDK
jgi:hypothetical protein